MNRKEFDLSGIAAWHKAGYTGKNIRIANMEGTDPALHFFHGKIKDPFNNVSGVGKNYHGHQTADILHQVVPEADIYILSSSGRYGSKTAEGDFVDVSIPFMEEEEIHLVNASLGGVDNPILNARIRQAQERGTAFVTSAGNEADSGVGGYARSGVWIAVGAVHLQNEKIVPASYSSIDEEVDFVQFSNLYVHDARPGYEHRTFQVQGTSFASPAICGMLALVQQFFLEKTGRTLTQNELYEFMKDHSIDLWEPGHDPETGYGLFVLPDTDSIDIRKYVGKEGEGMAISTNYTKGRNGRKIIAIVNHITAGYMPGCLEWMKKLNSKVSAHYLITRDGQIIQLVDEKDTAWHAGEVKKPNWLLYDGTNPNQYTIGIEHEGFPQDGLTEAQYQATLKLHKELVKRHQIPIDKDHIIGHYRINSVDRVNCPGPKFPWDRIFSDLQKEEKPVEKKDYEGHWAASSIQKVQAAGIMNGYPDGSFKPDQPVTRAELATVVAKLLEKLA